MTWAYSEVCIQEAVRECELRIGKQKQDLAMSAESPQGGRTDTTSRSQTGGGERVSPLCPPSPLPIAGLEGARREPRPGSARSARTGAEDDGDGRAEGEG